jgi:nucleoid-associated protein YgaU
MQRDLKIGLVLGLGLVSAAVLWLATRPSLSPKARIQRLHTAGARQEPADQPIVPVIANSQTKDFSAGQRGDLSTSSEEVPIDDIAAASENEQDNVPDSTIYEQTEKIKPERFHIVRKDQTLSGIAYEYYGSAGKWPKIFEANRKTIKDANILTPGTKLMIPD